MFLNFLLGKRELFEADKIAEFINTAHEFDAQRENTKNAGVLLLFKTSEQQTWLIATSERLYCVLDDIKHPKPEIRWTMPRHELVAHDSVSVHIRTRKHTENSGRVDIDGHTGWLFSKSLFATLPIEDAIKALIHIYMIGGPVPEMRIGMTAGGISGWQVKHRPQEA